jgi:hypothetical protein
MIVKFLEKIRNKPDDEKKIYAWVVTGAVVAVIFCLWLSFGLKFSSPIIGQVSTEKKTKESQIMKFIKEAQGDLTQVKDDISKVFGNLFPDKNEPKEIPNEAINEVLPSKAENPPLTLPKTE